MLDPVLGNFGCLFVAISSDKSGTTGETGGQDKVVDILLCLHVGFGSVAVERSIHLFECLSPSRMSATTLLRTGRHDHSLGLGSDEPCPEC